MDNQEEVVKKAVKQAKEEFEKEKAAKKEQEVEEKKEDKDIDTKNKEFEKAKEKPNDKKKGKAKLDKKDEKIEKLLAEIEELKDKDIRRMAEFENFRKRTEKEKMHMYSVGAKEVIEKILPVLDSFERGLSESKDTEDPFVKGMQMVYKQMQKSLEEIGVKEIECDGKEFDPNFHNAVMHEDNPDLGENVIVETLQKGYTYKDEVVRYAMVKVAN